MNYELFSSINDCLEFLHCQQTTNLRNKPKLFFQNQTSFLTLEFKTTFFVLLFLLILLHAIKKITWATLFER